MSIMSVVVRAPKYKYIHIYVEAARRLSIIYYDAKTVPLFTYANAQWYIHCPPVLCLPIRGVGKPLCTCPRAMRICSSYPRDLRRECEICLLLRHPILWLKLKPKWGAIKTLTAAFLDCGSLDCGCSFTATPLPPLTAASLLLQLIKDIRNFSMSFSLTPHGYFIVISLHNEPTYVHELTWLLFQADMIYLYI